MSQRIEFTTSDEIKIIADYYSPTLASQRGIILLHMMPATRQSWNNFAQKLEQAGYQVLAIDSRGHGESGGGNYQDFNDAQHQASINDLEAAAEFLRGKGVRDLAVGGASIGANLSLQYLRQHPEIEAAVLLSPGLDYRGIQIEPLANAIPDKGKILFIGAEDDVETMGDSPTVIANKLGFTNRIIFETGGHGTNILKSHPPIADEIVTFLNAH